MSLFSGHGGSTNLTESADAGLHGRSDSIAGLGTNRGKGGSPFYAGFGNRLTDALSYRSVNIPSTRIFTINSLSEISLDLLSLNNYKTAYGTMREIVDHYFPPVGLLVKGGGEEFTDFNYWREKPLDIVDFTDSESEDEDDSIQDALLSRLDAVQTKGSILSEDEAGDELMDSILSDPRLSLEESVAESFDPDEDDEELTSSMMQDDDEELTSSMMQDEEDLASSMMQDEDKDGDVEDEAEDEDEPSPPRTPEQSDSGRLEDPQATPRKSSDLPNGKVLKGSGVG
jgi:phosphatidate phosphatase LPIN